MIICKQPKIGAKVPIHTDSTFLYTHPATAIGFWIALEDVTETNGALSFLPGSHVDPRGGVGKRFVRMKSRAEGGEGGTGFIDWDEENGRERPEGEAGKDEVDWEKEPGWELATCKAGSLVLIDGEFRLICQLQSCPSSSQKVSTEQEMCNINRPTTCQIRPGSSTPST
jgi:hypothetical protein